MKSPFDRLISRYGQGKNQWAWRHVTGNSPNLNAKTEKIGGIKTQQNIRELWDNFKVWNICIIEISDGEGRTE